VLLAGRFDDNRPLLATYRPAPVQVSMHDPATSGLDEIDYLIADRGLAPRRTRERFTERVACLPTFYLHPPLRRAAARRGIRDGRITFGSFNNPAKLNADVVALWARVLHSVPGSRLLLRYRGVFLMPGVRERYLALFSAHGIAEDRLIVPAEPRDGRDQHLARYDDVDIALDPFPFTGSTTTFEALSMGVPVVTLEGERMVARWSLAMMRKVGLAHLVARNADEYVEIARRLAGAPDELARLRRELPERVVRSPLCAERGRTRQLERLYRRMWTIRCGKRDHQP
jgi:protein O-GlcNAc transferase